MRLLIIHWTTEQPKSDPFHHILLHPCQYQRDVSKQDLPWRTSGSSCYAHLVNRTLRWHFCCFIPAAAFSAHAHRLSSSVHWSVPQTLLTSRRALRCGGCDAQEKGSGHSRGSLNQWAPFLVGAVRPSQRAAWSAWWTRATHQSCCYPLLRMPGCATASERGQTCSRLREKSGLRLENLAMGGRGGC